MKAVAAGKDLIGKGYKILAGSVSSGVALQMAPLAEQNKVLFISGPAATDAVTGINKYTFRSGRQTYQDVKTAATFLKGVGKNVTVFAQDSVFGAGNFSAVNLIVGGQGHKVSRLLVPLSAQDFTPFAQQVKQANPDLLFVAWAGTTAPAMWRALEQQGVFGVSNKITTGSRRAGDLVGVRRRRAEDRLPLALRLHGAEEQGERLPRQLDAEAQPGARPVHAGRLRRRPDDRPRAPGRRGDNVDRMISALEGWNFVGPKGQQSIRAADHAMIQPMFQVKLVNGERQAPAEGDRPDQGPVRRPAGAALTGNP